MTTNDAEGPATNRLCLEPLREAHADEMVSVLAPPELYEFTGGTGPTLDELTRRYRAQVAGPIGTEEIWRNWILREVESGSAVGFVQATIVGSTADVAWLVGLDFQGRGFATEGAVAMCEDLESGGVDRFVAYIHPAHVSSQRIASALGMTRTGAVEKDGEEIWAVSQPKA